MKRSWDERYSEDGYLFGTEPEPFLVAQGHRLSPGMRALAVGDGEGRHGVWLAEQGLTVTSMDTSEVAQAKARALAARRGVEIHTLQADATTWQWPQAAFDLIVVIYVHFPPAKRERTHQAITRALRPGGLLVMEVFHRDQARSELAGPDDPAMLYTEEELATAFAGLDILSLEDAPTTISHHGQAVGEGRSLRLLARAPR